MASTRSTRQPRMCRAAKRVGATALECALTLPIMLFALFALLDLGLAATRYNALAEASRQIAREAILHGSKAPTQIGSWGPTPFVGTAADASVIAASAQSRLPTMPHDLVHIQVTWPDNANAPRDRVQVEITYQHDPLVPGWLLWGRINLRSVTTMRIVN